MNRDLVKATDRARDAIVAVVGVIGVALFVLTACASGPAASDQPAHSQTPQQPELQAEPSDDQAEAALEQQPQDVQAPAPLAEPPTVSACDAAELGDSDLGTVSLLDLDSDGDDDAVAPIALIPAGPGTILQLDVYEHVRDCEWRAIATLFDGDQRDTDHNIVSHQWLCTTDWSGAVVLTQVQARTRPDLTQTVTNISFAGGYPRTHAPTTVTGVDVVGQVIERDGFPCSDMTLSHPVDRCSGERWAVELPAGWQTPVSGPWSCSVFTQEQEGVPCQCDRVYPLQIRWVEGEQNVGPGEFTESTVAGLPARVRDASAMNDLAGRVTRTRTWTVEVAGGAIELIADDSEVPQTPTSWDDLVAQLDAMAATLAVSA